MRNPMAKITLNVDLENNEGTESPWWAIIDPRQNFKADSQGIHNIANMITGPFFSRGSAETHLEARRHAFSGHARVFCFSGYWSNEYKKAINEAQNDRP